MSTALIVLTLNEIDGVKNILPKIDQKLVNEILVVDGGSTDGTIEHVKKLGYKIIIQSIKGHGGAILTGVQNTKSDNIVFFGPDGNHDVNEIKQLIKKIDDLTLNKPRIKKRSLQKADILKTHGDNSLVKKITGIKKFTDTSVGLNNTVKWFIKNMVNE